MKIAFTELENSKAYSLGDEKYILVKKNLNFCVPKTGQLDLLG